jgi:hypothetical protein
MTNVALTQVPPETPWPIDPDQVDLLVPPPRRFRQSVLLTVATVLVVVVVVFVSGSGLVRPKLALDFDASYTAASPTSRPSVAFTVQNTGRFPLSIVGVDTRMAGLSGARVTIAQFGPEGELGPRHGFPLTLTGGGHAHITLTYASWKCQAIESHGSDTVPIHLSGPLGLNATVSVVPGFHFDPPDAGVLIGQPDANEIGWAAGITWMSCHPGSGHPNTAIPAP